jgi:hypothetical protein
LSRIISVNHRKQMWTVRQRVMEQHRPTFSITMVEPSDAMDDHCRVKNFQFFSYFFFYREGDK